MRINYVIATWSGWRRTLHPKYEKNPGYFLTNHLASLGSLDHNLTQVTIAVPDNPKEHSNFTALLKCIPKSFRNFKIDILYRPNIGLSYGSYSDVYKAYR